MSTLTTHFSLKKPASSDLVDDVTGTPVDLNADLDAIDTEMALGHHWSAADSGYVAWSGDPGQYTNGTLTLTSHTYYLSAMRVHRSASVSKIGAIVTATGTRTDFRLAVYNAAGTRLGTTGNVTASVASGYKAYALTASTNVTPDLYYVVIWSINTVTFTLASSTNSTGDPVAANDAAGGTVIRRYGQVSDGGSGTDVPASLTISSGSVTSPVFATSGTNGQLWCGLIT